MTSSNLSLEAREPPPPCSLNTSAIRATLAPIEYLHHDAGSSMRLYKHGEDWAECIRCLRCQRTLSRSAAAMLGRRGFGDLDLIADGSGRVRLGYNLYYCARCANFAGLAG